MNKIVLQSALRGSGNVSEIESNASFSISGSNSVYRTTVAHVPAAGSTIADATQLTAGFSLVDPVASGRGVIIPSLSDATGAIVGIKNQSTSLPLKVYAPAGQIILNSTSGDAFTLISNVCAQFVGISATTWVPMLDAGIGKY